MNPVSLVVRIDRASGDGRHVTTNTHDVISDCLAREGFGDIEGSVVVAAHKGRWLNTALTFGYYGISDGDRIVVAMKRPHVKRSRQFLDFASRQRRADVTFKKPHDLAKLQETARITDLAFSSWESMPEFQNLMKGILENDRRRREWFEETFMGNNPETVVKPASEICCDPLPALVADSSGPNGRGVYDGDFPIKQVITEPVESRSQC